jgi:hypothetical protein
MQVEDFIIENFSIGINGNGRLPEKHDESDFHCEGLIDYPFDKCEFVPMSGNGFN